MHGDVCLVRAHGREDIVHRSSFVRCAHPRPILRPEWRAKPREPLNPNPRYGLSGSSRDPSKLYFELQVD